MAARRGTNLRVGNPQEDIRMQHQPRGANARHGKQMEQGGLAQRKFLQQVPKRRSIRGPALRQALQGVLDLRGVERVRRLFLDPSRRFHRREKGSLMLRQSKRRTSNAERPMSNSESVSHRLLVQDSAFDVGRSAFSAD
jgi:hypothetical protein